MTHRSHARRPRRRILDLDTHDEAFVVISQVAAYLGDSVDTVKRKYIGCGLLKAYRFGGRWKVRVEDLRAFVESSRLRPSA